MHAVFGWCLMPLLTVFQVYRGCGQFMERGNQNARIKTADLAQIAGKLYNKVVSSTSRQQWESNPQLYTSVEMCIDFLFRCACIQLPYDRGSAPAECIYLVLNVTQNYYFILRGFVHKDMFVNIKCSIELILFSLYIILPVIYVFIVIR